MFNRSVYEPVNAIVFKSENHFLIFPKIVASVSPLFMFVRLEAAVKVGVWLFVVTLGTFPKSMSALVTVTSPVLPCTEVTLFTSAPSSMPFNLAVTSSIPV